MSEQAAVIDAPPATENAMPDAGAIFDAIKNNSETALNAVPPEQQQAQDDPQPAKPAKTEKPAKETTAPEKKPSKDDIPDELLTGKPEPEKKPDAEKDPFAYDPPASASEKTKTHWAAAKQVNAELKGEVEKLRAEIETVRKAPKQADETTVAELKSLREERDKIAKELELADFRRSPRFQKIESQQKAALETAIENLKGSDIDADVIMAAAVAKGKARLKILEDAGIEGSLLALVAPSLAASGQLQLA